MLAGVAGTHHQPQLHQAARRRVANVSHRHQYEKRGVPLRISIAQPRVRVGGPVHGGSSPLSSTRCGPPLAYLCWSATRRHCRPLLHSCARLDRGRCVAPQVSAHSRHSCLCRRLVALCPPSVGFMSTLHGRCVASTEADVQALTTTMLTSRSTLLRSYLRVHPAIQYRRAQGNLDSVLGKRPREADEDKSRETRARL